VDGDLHDFHFFGAKYPVNYDGVDEIDNIGCKLWTYPMGLSLIYSYCKKACANLIMFSILVAKNIQNYLHTKFTKYQGSTNTFFGFCFDCFKGNENIFIF
jgi:hypothetical protein